MTNPLECSDARIPSAQASCSDRLSSEYQSVQMSGASALRESTKPADYHAEVPFLALSDKNGSDQDNDKKATDQASPPEKRDQHELHKLMAGGGKIVEDDGEGGAIVKNDASDIPWLNYTAHYAKDGSASIDWKDGRHADINVDEAGTVHTSSTGKNPEDNYIATEAKDGTIKIVYPDGSTFVRNPDGSQETKGDLATANSRDTRIQLAYNTIDRVSDEMFADMVLGISLLRPKKK